MDVIHHLDQQRYGEESGSAVTANLFAIAATFAVCECRDVRQRRWIQRPMQSSGDVGWTRRARVAGHHLVYSPEAVVAHPPRSEASALLRKGRRGAEGSRPANRQGNLEVRPPYLNPWCLFAPQRERGRIRLRGPRPDPMAGGRTRPGLAGPDPARGLRAGG